jgi:hypothetical protein
LHRGVARLKASEITRWVIALKGCFAVVNERDNGLASVRDGPGFDKNKVAVPDLVFNHGLATDLKHVALAVGREEVIKMKEFSIFNGLDWAARSDATEDRNPPI